MSIPVLPLHVPSNSNLRPPPSPRTPLSRRSSGSRTPTPSLSSTFSVLTPQEAASRLGSSLSRGITPSEAGRRLVEYGSNELPREEPEPLWLRYLKQFKETLILLLLASAAISFVLKNYDDAISITLAVTIVTTVAFIQEYRSEQSIEALTRLLPYHAHLIRGADAFAQNHSLRGRNQRGHDVEMEKLMDGSADASHGPSDGGSSLVPASQLVPGDLVLFSTGDRIPADIRITNAADLSIDESNLTGENEPVVKFSDQIEHPFAKFMSGTVSPRSPLYASEAAGTVGADIRLNDRKNIAFMGTLVRSGHGCGLVIATGSATEFGGISASLQEIESPRTPLQLTMDRLGQELSYVSFAVIGLIVLVGVVQGRQILDMFTIGVSLAVAAIPEGLPIIVTVTLALGVLRMARRGTIVRKLPSVETLGSVNVICSDKTGTLTMNHMTVTKLWHFDADAPFDISKVVTSSNLDPAVRNIFRIGNIANNARLAKNDGNSPATASSAAILSSTMGDDPAVAHPKSRWVGQPTDVAMLDLLDAMGEDDVRERLGARASETPFSSDRKWMGVVIGDAADKNLGSSREVAYLKGALERVLKRCDTYLTKDGREVTLDEQKRQMAIKAAEKMADEGLRVLGFASGSVKDSSRTRAPSRSRSATPRNGYRKTSTPLPDKDIDVYQGLTFAGIVGMNDPPRKDVDKSIRRLMTGGVRVIMITGDAETTAVAIGRKLGMPLNPKREIASEEVLRGEDIDRMTDEELALAIPRTSIFARTSPEHKMKIVHALQARGDIVAMTGDGVNDAPALKKADIGISMGRLGTDVAKEAADMVLTDDNFSTILAAIEEGKGIFYNIQNFITFQLSTSVAALSLVLLSTFFGFKNPLNAMQILWINILMDGPPAQSLGVEAVDPAVMTRPPRAKHARVITKRLLRRVLTSAIIIMSGTMFTYVREMAIDGTVTARDTTMTFTCFVFFDMFNALTCRSESKSALRGELDLIGNKMFNYAVLGSLVGQFCVIYMPLLQRVFQTEALGFWDLIWLACLASSVFWADEMRKWYMGRRRLRHGLSGYSISV